jgi:D-serine deaminase-like pyridoxal phosphate-dependent protein
VVADSADVVDGLSTLMQRAGLVLPLLGECDTGAQRCGVTTPERVALLALYIATSSAYASTA